MEQLLLLPPSPFTPGVSHDSTILYCPSDVEAAYQEWGANCGPAALAAVLGVPLARVRRLFPEFARKPWVNPSTMWTALSLARRPARKLGQQWPAYGLCHIQWEGPWLSPGVPIGAAYRHTHWIGAATSPAGRPMIYDINADAWLTMASWEQEVVSLITEMMPRATGGWHIRWSCAVEEKEPLP